MLVPLFCESFRIKGEGRRGPFKNNILRHFCPKYLKYSFLLILKEDVFAYDSFLEN